MSIRTTVVLDEDVLERVREKALEEHVPFRTKLNDLLRLGLRQTPVAPKVPFEIQAFDMGEISLPHPIRISELDSIEDEERFSIKTLLLLM